jgi:ankyrin repeat protein
MSAKPLASRPDLSQYKKQAKDLLKAHKTSQADAVPRLMAHIGRLSVLSTDAVFAAKISLREAQHVIAREHGFADWSFFKNHIESLAMAKDTGSSSSSAKESETRRAVYFRCVRANDVSQVRAILTSYPDLVHQRIADLSAEPWQAAEPANRKSNTALHWTALHYTAPAGQSYAPLAQVLIEYGADIDALGYNENKGVAPAVVLAAWEGELALLRILLEAGADPNLPATAESALYAALEHTAPDAAPPNKVSVLLEYGAQHDIFTAAMSGRTDLVETFLNEYDALIDRRSLKRNRTPLEEAVTYSRWQVAQLLIDRGAVVSVHTTAAMGLIDKLETIIGADPHQIEARDDSQETPLLVAARHGRTEAVEVLLRAGADANSVNRWQITALHEAVGSGNAQTATKLLKAGADPATMDRSGKTAFAYADPKNKKMARSINPYQSHG